MTDPTPDAGSSGLRDLLYAAALPIATTLHEDSPIEDYVIVSGVLLTYAIKLVRSPK